MAPALSNAEATALNPLALLDCCVAGALSTRFSRADRIWTTLAGRCDLSARRCVSRECRVSSAQEPEKLLKLAALYSLAQLPDCAAEILVNFREHLAPIFDIETGLDILTQAAHIDDMPSTYREYIAAFEADDPCFYPRPSGGREAPTQDSATSADNCVGQASANEARAENERLRAELRAVYASTSWNITAPLRWMSHNARSASSKVSEWISHKR